jgi:hypothetical protein
MTAEFRAPTAWGVTRALAAVVGVLLAASVAGQVAKHWFGLPQLKGFVPAFYVDYESNVPTWYSSCALLAAAALLGFIALAKTSSDDRHRWHWALLSLIFVGLSADEVAGFHEYPIDAMRETFGLSGVLFYPWVILGAVFLLGVAATMARMVWSLPARTRRLFILAAVVFAGGALGIEMLSGLQASRLGEENFGYAMIVTAEEACEMLGVVVLIHALVDYIHCELGMVRLSIGRPATGETA